MDAETIWRMPEKEVVSLVERGYFPNSTGHACYSAQRARLMCRGIKRCACMQEQREENEKRN